MSKKCVIEVTFRLEENVLDQYTLDQGIIDCQAYYQAGSVFEALQTLAQQAGQQAEKAKSTLQQMKTVH